MQPLVTRDLQGLANIRLCPVYEALGPGWATSLLGFVSLALLPIPFAFARYGERLRQHSKYAAGE